MSKRFIFFGLLGSIASMLFIFQHYLFPISVGFVLTLATSPIYESLERRITSKHKKLYIAIILTTILFLLVFFPLIYFIGTSYKYLPQIDMEKALDHVSNIVEYLKNLPQALSFLQQPVNAVLKQFNINDVNMKILQSLLGSSINILARINSLAYQFFLILFFYFIFNMYSKKLFLYTMDLIPLEKTNKRLLFHELTNTISSVFIGTLFSMILQGIAFGLLIYLTTDYDALYLGLMVAFTTAIPVIGTYLVALPIALLEILDGNVAFAIMLIFFAVVVLSGIIDQVLRMMFMKIVSRRLHLEYSISELFLLIAMIAGISVFGGWGIILAPATLSLNLTFIHIYKRSQHQRTII